MTSSFLLLSAAVLCLAVYGCVGTRPYAVTRKPQCEKMAIKTCNVKFRDVFWKAAGKGFRNGSSEFYFYCKAIQTFMDCLNESLANCSGGKWLSEYSFVVLEHGMMDKKCNVCDHRLEHLTNSLNARSKQDYVGSDCCPICAKHVHKKCVREFLRTLNKNPNMCVDIQAFINCYKEEGKPGKPCAAEAIVKKFSHLCKMQGERMLIQNKIHPGLMCPKERSD